MVLSKYEFMSLILDLGAMRTNSATSVIEFVKEAHFVKAKLLSKSW